MRSVKAPELSKDNVGQWIVLGNREAGDRGLLVEVARVPDVAPNGRGPADREGVCLAIHGGGMATSRAEQMLELEDEVMVGDSPDEVLLAQALS